MILKYPNGPSKTKINSYRPKIDFLRFKIDSQRFTMYNKTTKLIPKGKISTLRGQNSNPRYLK